MEESKTKTLYISNQIEIFDQNLYRVNQSFQLTNVKMIDPLHIHL